MAAPDEHRPTIEDIAAMRADGDLKDYLLSLTGRAPAKPKPTLTAVPSPGYRIAHRAAGRSAPPPPAPPRPPTQCTCAKCGGNPASRQPHRDTTAA
jgi:hypothetical protein